MINITSMNNSFNLFPFNGSSLEIKAETLIKNYVIQINNKILLAILLIFTGYMFYSSILPRAKLGLDELTKTQDNKNFKFILDFNKKVIDWLISFSETLALGSSLFLFGIAYYQGIIPKSFLIWAFSLFSLLLLICLVEIIGFFRNKKHKILIKKIKGIELETSEGLQDGQ